MLSDTEKLVWAMRESIRQGDEFKMLCQEQATGILKILIAGDPAQMRALVDALQDMAPDYLPPADAPAAGGQCN